MTYKIFLLCGIPGSGKSTWAEEMADGQEDVCRVISRDNIRLSLLKEGEPYYKRENEAFAKFVKEINDSIYEGVENIFIDATHINPQSRAKILRRLRIPRGCALSIEVFTTPMDICLQRNSKRTGLRRVPDAAIKSMMKDFSYPTVEEIKRLNLGFQEIEIDEHDDWL